MVVFQRRVDVVSGSRRIVDRSDRDLDLAGRRGDLAELAVARQVGDRIGEPILDGGAAEVSRRRVRSPNVRRRR